ncbi:MAG: hypothetical protein WCD00_08890 [Desulfuromonadaceae bacterium]
MNAFRTFLISTAIIAMLFIPFAYQAGATAPGPKVSELSAAGKGNKHNLSAKAWPSGTTNYSNTADYIATDNPNTYKAFYDPTGNPKGQQICIFCHTPHSANVEGGAPLWNRAFSTQTFSRYSSATLQIRLKSATTTATAGYGTSWQPDGSSKLCLSCHDGVSSLGAVLNGGTIAMVGGNDVILSIASFNPSNNKMKTGHHPVSFVYDETIRGAIDTGKFLTNIYKLPSIGAVKLDKKGKMQCTTCHNAHQNQSHDDQCYNVSGDACDATYTRKKAPFWVYGGSGSAAADQQDVCLTCHPYDGTGGFPAYTPGTTW